MQGECPECQAPVSYGATVCRSCGYRDPTVKAPASADRWRCVDVDRGLRCAKMGTLSLSTNGSGPWYCADHFPWLRSSAPSRQDRAYGAQRLGELTWRFKPAPMDDEAAAERAAIMAEAVAN